MKGTARLSSLLYWHVPTATKIRINEKLSPGWIVELHDDNGKLVNAGEEGRIAIKLDPRPVGLFVEYIDNPAENTNSFINGYYYTGDKAYCDDDGYFWFVGRDTMMSLRVPATG